MAKTGNSVAQACAKIEIQPGCTGTWYDIGGETMTISMGKEAAATGSMAVFNSDTHVLNSGKKEPLTVTISGIYTEEATEAFEKVRAIWGTAGCNKQICARATPQGGTIGDLEIYIGDATDRALLVGFGVTGLDAGSGDPVAFEFDVFGNYTYDTKAS